MCIKEFKNYFSQQNYSTRLSKLYICMFLSMPNLCLNYAKGLLVIANCNVTLNLHNRNSILNLPRPSYPPPPLPLDPQARILGLIRGGGGK